MAGKGLEEVCHLPDIKELTEYEWRPRPEKSVSERTRIKKN